MPHFTTAFHLETSRLGLRPFAPHDAPAIVDALNDAEMCRGLTVVPFPNHLEDAHWFINEGSTDAMAVCLQDGSLIGAVGLGNTLGYWIAKPHWSNGYATEAAKPLLSQHFSQTDKPVSSNYVDDNHGSATVLAKLRFEITGDTMLPIKSRNGTFPAKEVLLSKTRWEQIQ